MRRALLAALVSVVVVAGTAAAQDPMLTPEDFEAGGRFEVVGSFKINAVSSGVSNTGAADSNNGIAFWPGGNGGQGSLFVPCHWPSTGTSSTMPYAEVTIPNILSLSTSLADLTPATILQDCADPSEGRVQQLMDQEGSPSSIISGGVTVIDDKIIFQFGVFYDGSGNFPEAMYWRPVATPLATTGIARGPFPSYTFPVQLNDFLVGYGGYMSGPIGQVPSSWRTAMHGDVWSTDAKRSIISRYSFGPSVLPWQTSTLGDTLLAGQSAVLTSGSAVINLSTDNPDLSHVVDNTDTFSMSIAYGQGRSDMPIDPFDSRQPLRKARRDVIVAHDNTAKTVTLAHTMRDPAGHGPVPWVIGMVQFNGAMLYRASLGQSLCDDLRWSGDGNVDPAICQPPFFYWDAVPTNVFWNQSFIRQHAVWIPGTRTILHISRGHFGSQYYGIATNATFDANHSEPNPPVTAQYGTGSASDASTIAGAAPGYTRIQLPNLDVNSISTDKVICLAGETTPIADAGSSNSQHPGCGYTKARGNSGTPTAFWDVSGTFTLGLTGKTYTIGEGRSYQGDNTGDTSQGNHGFPYGALAYLTDAQKIADNSAANNSKTHPDYLIAFTNIPDPEPRNPAGPFNEQAPSHLMPFPPYDGQISGLTSDLTNKLVFLAAPTNADGGLVITVYRVNLAPTSAKIRLGGSQSLILGPDGRVILK